LSKLTPKQERFCQEFLIDLNATKAAERAGFSEGTAAQQGYQLLKKPHVQEEITRLQIERADRVQAAGDDVLIRLDTMANVDVIEYFDDNGAFKSLKEIPPEIRKCIESIEVFEEYDVINGRRIKIGEIKKIRFGSKIRSNELLGKHRGHWKEKVELSGKVSFEQFIAGSNTKNQGK